MDNMYGYAVTINTERDHYEHDGEQWGSWSAASSHNLQRIVKKVDGDGHPDIASVLDIKSGANAIVVWVVWSSGDSFGWHDGASSEAIGIFTDIDAAQELVNHINNHPWKKDPVLNFKTSDGQEFHCGFVGWSGYFESLDDVNIDGVTVF
jgi:hypothetical protein